MPAWRCTEEGERGAVCGTPETDQQEPEQLNSDQGNSWEAHILEEETHTTVSQLLCSLPAALFSLSTSPHSNPRPLVPGPVHTGFFGSAERHGPLMCPRAATLRPPAFQRPVLGYCVHILSLFVHLPEGPSPAAPLPQPQPP